MQMQFEFIVFLFNNKPMSCLKSLHSKTILELGLGSRRKETIYFETSLSSSAVSESPLSSSSSSLFIVYLIYDKDHLRGPDKHNEGSFLCRSLLLVILLHKSHKDYFLSHSISYYVIIPPSLVQIGFAFFNPCKSFSDNVLLLLLL